MEINNTGSTYGAAFRQKPIFFMSGKETVAFFEGKLKKNMTLQEDSCTLGSNDRGKGSISATGKRILYSVGIQNRRIILCMMQK